MSDRTSATQHCCATVYSVRLFPRIPSLRFTILPSTLVLCAVRERHVIAGLTHNLPQDSGPAIYSLYMCPRNRGTSLQQLKGVAVLGLLKDRQTSSLCRSGRGGGTCHAPKWRQQDSVATVRRQILISTLCLSTLYIPAHQHPPSCSDASPRRRKPPQHHK